MRRFWLPYSTFLLPYSQVVSAWHIFHHQRLWITDELVTWCAPVGVAARYLMISYDILWYLMGASLWLKFSNTLWEICKGFQVMKWKRTRAAKNLRQSKHSWNVRAVFEPIIALLEAIVFVWSCWDAWWGRWVVQMDLEKHSRDYFPRQFPVQTFPFEDIELPLRRVTTVVPLL